MKNTKRPRLITFTDPHSPIAEAFRTLRTNIQFAGVDKPIKTMLITSATMNCGKTTITANLGVAMAQTGSSVLVVDADLRKPTLHRYFSMDNEPGLTNILFDVTMDLNMSVNKSRINNLFVLASGPVPPNPAELLSTEKMKKVIEVLADSFDYVLFDSPPVNAVTDPAILSCQVDATLLVLDYGFVTRDEAAFALEQLKKVRANVIGAVLNGMPNSQGYYHYYHYHYYGEEYAGKKENRRARRNIFSFNLKGN